MPAALDAGDRKLLLIAGTILLVLIAATVVFAPASEQDQGRGIPTTYSTKPGGSQAAYLLLRDLGYKSERWERPPTELPAYTPGKILIIAGPINFPEKSEREALVRFVRSGGWIVYAGSFPFLFLGEGNTNPRWELGPSSPLQTFSSVSPSPLTRDADRITMYASSSWNLASGAEIPLYGDADNIVALTRRLDRGRIIWWASATPITNSEIANQQNLPFFLDCIQAVTPGAPPGQITVLWDEYFHGYGGSLWNYFQETPVPWAIFQLCVLALFVLLAFSRRSGPLYAPAAESRLSPLEFVDTLGDLYRHAHASPSAVRVAYQRFRTQLVRRLAFAPAVSNAQLDTAVRERLHWKEPGFMDTLQRADHAVRAADLHDSDALKIVQALEHYEVLFGLKSRPKEEKR